MVTATTFREGRFPRGASRVGALGQQGLDSPPLTSRESARDYVDSVCFTYGPPRLIGAELEWLTAGPGGVRPEPADLRGALGPHSPRQIDPYSPATPLAQGSLVTVEPGGQIELSSAPRPSAREVCDDLSADYRTLLELLATSDISTYAEAADGHRTAQRTLDSPRYRAMESRFDKIGPFGTLMMCNTAATQISVDAGGDEDAVQQRWLLLHAMGPAMVAAFACSPQMHGIPLGPWASQRMRTWLELDTPRTCGTAHSRDYGRWAVEVPLLCARQSGTSDWATPFGMSFGDWVDEGARSPIGRVPTIADLDYHLTTLFPPVRAAGHLEVRYIDTQPGDLWRVPLAAYEALLSGPGAIGEALGAVRSTCGRWTDAAEFGLADLDLRAAATALLSLAASYSPDPGFVRLLDAAAERCCRGLAPGQDE